MFYGLNNILLINIYLFHPVFYFIFNIHLTDDRFVVFFCFDEGEMKYASEWRMYTIRKKNLSAILYSDKPFFFRQGLWANKIIQGSIKQIGFARPWTLNSALFNRIQYRLSLKLKGSVFFSLFCNIFILT